MKSHSAILAAVCLLSLASGVIAAQWTQVTSLPDGYSDHSLAYFGGFLYQAGGSSNTRGEADGTNVFYAQVLSGGTIGPWQSATPLPEAVLDHAGIAAKSFVYVLGGDHYYPASDTDVITNTVYRARINSDGSLGAWDTVNALPQPAYFPSASVWDNTIYLVGGYNGQVLLNTVYSARIQADGSLSAWAPQTPLPVPVGIYTHSSVANGMLYVLGGAVNSGAQIVNSVYYSRINADGTLAGWNQTAPMPQTLSNFGAVVASGRVFAIAGFNGHFVANTFYSAAVNGDGSLGNWSAGPLLPHLLYLLGAASTGSYIFVSGGFDTSIGQDGVYSFPLPSPPAFPVLTSQRRTNGNFQIKLASDTNTGFGIQASTNLTDWTRIGSGFTDTNGSLLFQDTNAPDFPRRFYRAFWPLP